MKLLLTSAGFENPNIGKEFLKLVDKPANEIKILFIPTAARSKEEQDYANKSKQELYDLGINYDNIKIYYIKSYYNLKICLKQVSTSIKSKC